MPDDERSDEERMTEDERSDEERPQPEPFDRPETVSEDEEGAAGTLGLPDLTGDDDD